MDKNKEKNYLEETKEMLESMKDIRTVANINKDIEKKEKDITDLQIDIDKLKKEQEDNNKVFMDRDKRNEDVSDISSQISLLGKNIATFFDLLKHEEEELKKLEEEKEKSDAKFKEITEYKFNLEKKIRELNTKYIIEKGKFADNSLKIIELLKDINENRDKYTKEEISSKKEEIKKLKEDRMSKEQLMELKAEKEEIDKSIKVIDEFKRDPKKYFEKIEENDKKTEKKEQRRIPVYMAPQNTEGTRQQSVPNYNTVHDKEDVQGQKSTKEPAKNTVQMDTIERVEYDSKVNKYKFTDVNGNAMTYHKEPLNQRLIEERRLYKEFRGQGDNVLTSIRKVFRLDPNITKVLSLNQDTDAMKKYDEYINGADNGFVDYSFSIGLIDARLKVANRLRNKLIEKINAKKNQEVQEPGKQSKEPEYEDDLIPLEELQKIIRQTERKKNEELYKASQNQEERKTEDDVMYGWDGIPFWEKQGRTTGESAGHQKFMGELDPNNGEYAENEPEQSKKPEGKLRTIIKAKTTEVKAKIGKLKTMRDLKANIKNKVKDSRNGEER